MAHRTLEEFGGARIRTEFIHDPMLVPGFGTSDGMMEVAVGEFETGTVCDVEV